MLTKFDAHNLLSAISNLSDMEAIGRQTPDWSYGTQDKTDYLVTKTSEVLAETQKLGLRLSARKADFLVTMLKIPSNRAVASALAQNVTSALSELRELIAGELEERAVYAVDPKGTEILKKLPLPFGNAVADKFPMAVEDMAEACWCLGLARNTAAVFHLMRTMEVAVRSIGATFKVTVVDKDDVDLEWGKILANLKIPIEALPRGAERDHWSGILTLLYHVKQKWRNTTMHPKQTYTDDEARDVYDAVRSFMLDLVAVV
jgi:hypothetical protein